jgi:hypothetical protein
MGTPMMSPTCPEAEDLRPACRSEAVTRPHARKDLAHWLELDLTLPG